MVFLVPTKYCNETLNMLLSGDESVHNNSVMCTLTSFMIHDSLGFSKIHVDSIQFNSFMTRFHKGFNSRFTKAGSSTELVQLTIQLTYDSLHQIQLNGIQQKQDSFLIRVNTGTQA